MENFEKKEETTETVKETFRSILKKSNKDIQSTRAARISSIAKMEYENLVNEKKRQIFTIENDLEAMSDISTSNVTTTANAIKGIEFDAQSFVKKRARLREQLLLCKEELAILEDDKEFYE